MSVKTPGKEDGPSVLAEIAVLTVLGIGRFPSLPGVLPCKLSSVLALEELSSSILTRITLYGKTKLAGLKSCSANICEFPFKYCRYLALRGVSPAKLAVLFFSRPIKRWLTNSPSESPSQSLQNPQIVQMWRKPTCRIRLNSDFISQIAFEL